MPLLSRELYLFSEILNLLRSGVASATTKLGKNASVIWLFSDDSNYKEDIVVLNKKSLHGDI